MVIIVIVNMTRIPTTTPMIIPAIELVELVLSIITSSEGN